MSSLTERAHEADEEPAKLPVVALPARLVVGAGPAIPGAGRRDRQRGKRQAARDVDPWVRTAVGTYKEGI